MWNLPPPPGFQGLREDLPLRVYVRHLPHWRQDGATWLDDGIGDCRLRNTDAAQAIAGSMHHFDGKRYELGCYVVMPNHVHVVVKPLGPEVELEDILKSWKSYSALGINSLTGGSGPVWQDESCDRIIRDEEQLWRTVQYIGCNPKKARIPLENCLRWVRPQWVEMGWGYCDEE